jgi:hypothetical protein
MHDFSETTPVGVDCIGAHCHGRVALLQQGGDEVADGRFASTLGLVNYDEGVIRETVSIR